MSFAWGSDSIVIQEYNLTETILQSSKEKQAETWTSWDEIFDVFAEKIESTYDQLNEWDIEIVTLRLLEKACWSTWNTIKQIIETINDLWIWGQARLNYLASRNLYGHDVWLTVNNEEIVDRLWY